MPQETASDQVTRRAGRGFMAIMAAKLYFLFAGYAIVVALSWVLGRGMYGVYVLVVGAISVFNNVIVTGTIQAVSRFTARDDAQAGAVKLAALKLQILVGGGVAAAFALAAPLIARFERDPSLTPYLRLAAVIVLCYAFYAVFVGSANGLRRFHVQAGLDAFYATIRCALIVGLAAAGFGAGGAVAGFVAASMIIVAVSAVVLGVRDLRGGVSPWEIARFVFPVMAYLILVNLAMFADLFLLKRIAGEALGLGAEAASEVAGSYGPVQQIARVTYQALLAVTFVVFPLVSKSTFEADQEATRGYVRTTMRYSLIMGVAIAVVLVALPGPVLAVLFPPEFQSETLALAVLGLGYVAYSMFIVGTTILNAAGRKWLALGAAAAMMIAVVGLCWLLLGRATTSAGIQLAAAAGAAIGMGLGWLLVSIALRRVFGSAIPLATLLRVALACAGAAAVGHFLLPQGSRVMTLAECAVVEVVYLGLLVATRELGRADLSRVSKVLKRGT
jgi:O-antigen/teichoic acid export membrane protein